MLRSHSYLALFIFIVGALVFASCTSKPTPSQEKSSTQEPAKEQTAEKIKELKDYDLELLDDSGSIKVVKLSQAIGKGQVVIIDFWATWCGPCRASIPDLIAAQNEYRDKGVKVFGLSTEDSTQDKDKVMEMAKAFKINYEVGFTSQEMFRTFGNGRPSIPQSFVFGKNGKLVKHLVGFSATKSPKFLRDAINAALES